MMFCIIQVLPCIAVSVQPTAGATTITAGVRWPLRVGPPSTRPRMNASSAAGAATWENCAMRVRATVVSRPTDTRAVFDCGTKVLVPWNGSREAGLP